MILADCVQDETSMDCHAYSEWRCGVRAGDVGSRFESKGGRTRRTLSITCERKDRIDKILHFCNFGLHKKLKQWP